MAVTLLIVGIILLISSIRNTQDFLVCLLRADFIGPGNFTYWIVAFVIVGAIGYVDKLKKVSDGLLVLLLIALFLSRGDPKSLGGGFFQKFVNALKTTGTSGVIVSGFGYTSGGSGPSVTIGGTPGGRTIGGDPTIQYPNPSIGIGFPGFGSPITGGVLTQ